MPAWLRRHPFPVEAFFRHSLVLAWAFPEEILKPLLPPGLELDTYDGNGFLAIALVQTERLRPVGVPRFLGRDFFLSGYRVFSRYRRVNGRHVRGLRILRSDADSSLMVRAGNLLTHYRYRKCRARTRRDAKELAIEIETPRGEADLAVVARLDVLPTTPPPGSPFPDLDVARRFAGPLPFTFDLEEESRSMVVIEGVRENWHPRPVSVEVGVCRFLDSPPFDSVEKRLANAFMVEKIPYRWKRGVVEPLGDPSR